MDDVTTLYDDLVGLSNAPLTFCPRPPVRRLGVISMTALTA